MLEVTLTAEKVTKNTVRYRENYQGAAQEPEPRVFPVVYIQKEALKALGSTTPETIKITVEVV